MPAPGDQHSSIANPFEEPQRRMSEYTAQEIATLQSRLERQLGPEYISARPGPSGQKIHYLAAEKCIALANEVFGFNGWSSSIQNIQVDFVDENPQTLKISLGLSVIVRVTLKDGTYHEDIGYGHIENCKGKAAAFEKAKKEGTTDALKRALRNFGNVLGNCIYDKDYLSKVVKIKAAPTKKFDVDSLHRHADFVVKKEPVETAPKIEPPKGEPSRLEPAPPPPLLTAESFDDFLGDIDIDEADFNISDEGHPDEVVLSISNVGSSEEKPANAQSNSNGNNMRPPPPRPLARSSSTGSNHPGRPQPHTPHQQQPPRPITNSFAGAQNNQSSNAQRPPQQFTNSNNNRPPVPPQNNNVPKPPVPSPQPGAQPGGGAVPETVGFFSARAVKQIPEEAIASGTIAPTAGQVFNPKAESPSIRKTPGIDHTKSKPVSKSGQHVPPNVASDNVTGGTKPMSRPGQPAGPAARGNIINPQLDQTRRIGAPGQFSPLANRGQYRPPTMKRPNDTSAPTPAGPGRPPLADVSKNVAAAGTGGMNGPDAKRQRTG